MPPTDKIVEKAWRAAVVNMTSVPLSNYRGPMDQTAMRAGLEAVWPEPTFTDEELAAVKVALYDRREALAAIDHRHVRLPAVCSAYRKVKEARANGS